MSAVERLIRVIGSIDENSFKEFSEELYILELENNKPVILELSSCGGVAYDALAFSGRMRNSPCDIIVKAYGLVASAAVLILASGDSRLMAKEAWVMVHEDSDKLKGNVVDLEREAAHLRRMEEQWAALLTNCSDKTVDYWRDVHKNTTYLTAYECLADGLVDELI